MRLENEFNTAAPDAEPIQPEAKAANEAQERRFEEQRRIWDEQAGARQLLEDDLDRRYGGKINYLQGEAKSLDAVLGDSGPVRLMWLKLTRQIGKDPELDLRALHTDIDVLEHQRQQERDAFEAHLREQEQACRQQQQAARQTQQAQSQHQSQTSASESSGSPTRDQAAERLEHLESTRPTPEAEPHLRPGGPLQHAVDAEVAARHEIEIATLAASQTGGHAAYAAEADARPDGNLEPYL